MKYTREEVLQYVQEEEVAFVHLTFCDVFGRQKNISIGMLDNQKRELNSYMNIPSQQGEQLFCVNIHRIPLLICGTGLKLKSTW